MAPLFPDFRKIRKRMKRSLSYGSKQPSSINFALSQLVVNYFDKKCTFDYMEPATSTMISKNGFADPCSLVVALVYLDRLKHDNKEYFESTDPVSLYVPALVLASKYLHDADTYDRVTNSEWAEAVKMNPEDLNRKEWDFVKNLNWNVAVQNEEFEKYLSTMESWVAGSFIEKNEFTTYNELLQLSSMIPIMDIIKQLVEFMSTASFIYCLTIALMTSTVSHLTSEPSTSTFIAESENRTHFEPIVITRPSSSQVFLPQPDYPLWTIEDEMNRVEKDENGTTDSSPQCPYEKARRAINQFRIALSPILSCYRQGFEILIK